MCIDERARLAAEWVSVAADWLTVGEWRPEVTWAVEYYAPMRRMVMGLLHQGGVEARRNGTVGKRVSE